MLKKNIMGQPDFYLGDKIGKNTGILDIHPSMMTNIVGFRKKVPIFNSKKTVQGLLCAFLCLIQVLERNGHIVIVNTNPDLSSLVCSFALQTKKFKNNFSYCNTKWVGGTLTNWAQISCSIQTFVSFSKKFERLIDYYTIHFPRYQKLKKSFQGFVPYSQTIYSSTTFSKKKRLPKPNLIILLNPTENEALLHEALNLGIPVIGLIGSTSKCPLLRYPIPVNNTSPFFIHAFFSCIERILESYKKKKKIKNRRVLYRDGVL